MKNFKQDIILFRQKIANGEHFSFSKYADGEWAVIQNKHINNKEFWFDPDNPVDATKREALIDSFKYQNDRYYVGISCPCCQGMDTFKEMRAFSCQSEDKLTWANLWVNGNYQYYVNRIVPLFKEKSIVLVCNENGKIENLPFIPYMVFPVKHNAWEYNWHTIEDMKSVITNKQIKDMIFLFCCGPFGNILCHELTKHEPRNTYLDIGSTLNPYLGSAGFERLYSMGDNFFSRMECVWGD